MSTRSAQTEGERVSAVLADARRQLLDLTFRNNFLNYRVLKARGAWCVGDEAARVASLLVEDGVPLRFIGRDEAEARRDAWVEKRDRARQQLVQDREPDVASGGVADPLKDSEATGTSLAYVGDASLRSGLNDRILVADHQAQDLAKRLVTTARTARSLIEERGVNTLFMALGTLTWFEAEASDTPRVAPLYLAPVVMESANVEHGYRVRFDGEDVQENHTLRERLLQEGIELPAFDDDQDLTVYLDAVAAAVSTKRRWSVDKTHVSLGFFSFTRYLMYLDLDVRRWPNADAVTGHPVVSRVLSKGFEPESDVFDDATWLDDEPAYRDMHHVLEVDGSQAQAVAQAMVSTALVIQGPPGTGKSQTIANLLAESLANGKRVLFVAEKKAALDVVKRRLDEVGLGPAVLELHSDKATRAAVGNDLRRTLELGKPREADRLSVSQRLEAARRRLNGYVDALHRPFGDTGFTPYGLMGRGVTAGVSDRLDLAALRITPDGRWTRQRHEHLLALARDVEAWVRDHGPVSWHPYRHVGVDVSTPAHQRRWMAALGSCVEALATFEKVLGTLPQAMQQALSSRLGDAEAWATVLHAVAALRRGAPGVSVSPRCWHEEPENLMATAAAARDAHEVKVSGGRTVAPEAWRYARSNGAALKGVADDLSRRGGILYRWFSGRYRRAARAADDVTADGVRRSHDARVEAVGALFAYAQHAAIFQAGRDLWRELAPEADDLEEAARIAPAVIEVLRRLSCVVAPVPSGLLEEMASIGEAESERAATTLASAWHHLRECVVAALQVYGFEASSVFADSSREVRSLDDATLGCVKAVVEAWGVDPQGATAGTRWHRLRIRASEAGVGNLVGAVEDGELASTALERRLDAAILDALLDAAFEQRRELAAFDVDEHVQAVRDFTEIDAAQLHLHRQMLAAKHFSALPTMVGHGQTGVLAQEFNKKRRHRPVRRLMSEAGGAIQAIKPIFMMSPLSVAVFLPPGGIEFDLVVFDEASQVRPADALGALLRGRAAVVVGDDRQLPPTTFFDALLEDESESEDVEISDLESVLGLFGARAAKQSWLAWHYRSRHESLIAVSNHEFYDNRLMLFPSPDVSRGDAGVVFHHLPETVYDRGKSRVNVEEARAVAESVRQHALRAPQRSLGVATFSLAQATAIANEVDRLARDTPALEAFLQGGRGEPFFVKNLETVQGDERDVVFISVGYGRDRERRLTYGFGPLNQVGGERRLNVILTRARIRSEMFANFTDEDLDPARCTAAGVRALRTYIAFARTGKMLASQATARDDESPFEDAVARALSDRGHLVRRQVGQAGYFIDIGIADPERPGRMVLGIECDGATYHASRSARDRDRLRQDVLEGLGWRIHRVWSTDWYRDPKTSLERIEAAIAQAFDSEEAVDVGAAVATGDEGDPAFEQDPCVDAAAVPDGDVVDRGAARAISIESLSAQPYVVAKLPRLAYSGELFRSAPSHVVADWLRHVVLVEGPVHTEDAYRRVATAAGLTRIGKRIRAHLVAALRTGIERGWFILESGSLVKPGFDASTLQPRDRANLAPQDRVFARVPVVELDAAITAVVRSGHGILPDEVPHAVTRLLGFGRATDEVRATIEERVDMLLAAGAIVKNGSGVLVLAR